MAGNQSRGLIAASKTKGWDPTVIAGTGESIANFDVDQGNLAGKPVGSLPGGTPDGWANNWDNGRVDPAVMQNISADPPFRTPDYNRENVARRTSNANPFPGMSGALSKGGGR